MANVSCYIREAVDASVINPFDEDSARKLMKYVPFRAGFVACFIKHY